MTRYVLSPGATADIDDIWEYSAERWSIDQAERYVHDIRLAIELIADAPQRGRPCDELRPGYRKYPVGSHVIFFKPIADGIDVVRILHQRMDFERHL